MKVQQETEDEEVERSHSKVY